MENVGVTPAGDPHNLFVFGAFLRGGWVLAAWLWGVCVGMALRDRVCCNVWLRGFCEGVKIAVLQQKL